MKASLHQRYADNILIGAGVSSSPSPMATYSEATLLTHRPGDRVRWSSGTVTIHFTIGGSPSTPARADLLVIPVWNVDAGGSPGVAVLESDAGMSVPIDVPEMLPSGIPRTTGVDLTVLEPDESKRTSDGFDLIITGNSENLIMGGAVLLYGPKRSFIERDWHFGFGRTQRYFSTVHENDYGTDLVSTRRTRQRSYQLSTICTDAEALEFEQMIDANLGNGLPATLWPIPDVYEAFFGRFEEAFTQRIKTDGAEDAVEFSLTFTEISKGKPVA